MRKYGKWLLVLGVLAASPVAASADGLLGGRVRTPFSGSAQKVQNQTQADQVIAAMKDAAIQGSGVNVEVENGKAILDGKVFRASDRALAQRLAQSVAGITSVENNLSFAPIAASQVRTASGDAADSQVASEFETSSSRIQQVSGETQTVAAPATRTAVRSNARTAPARPAPDNQAVAQQIGDTLESVGLVGYDIEIRYNAGTATLIGDVATMQQRQAAGSSVSQIPGVKNVNNQLRVGGPVTPTAFNPQSAPMPVGPPQFSGPPQQYAGPPQQYAAPPQQYAAPQQQYAPQMMPAGYTQPGMQMDPSMMPSPTGYAPTSFNNPQLPGHAWPAYAQYPNSAAVTYPTQYSASAFPYIGPFYPYPQVPMGWREVSLEWDDGYWQLNFNKEKDKWYWILHPKNW